MTRSEQPDGHAAPGARDAAPARGGVRRHRALLLVLFAAAPAVVTVGFGTGFAIFVTSHDPTEPDPAAPKHIVTVSGVGYRFVME